LSDYLTLLHERKRKRKAVHAEDLLEGKELLTNVEVPSREAGKGAAHQGITHEGDSRVFLSSLRKIFSIQLFART